MLFLRTSSKDDYLCRTLLLDDLSFVKTVLFYDFWLLVGVSDGSGSSAIFSSRFGVWTYRISEITSCMFTSGMKSLMSLFSENILLILGFGFGLLDFSFLGLVLALGFLWEAGSTKAEILSVL